MGVHKPDESLFRTPLRSLFQIRSSIFFFYYSEPKKLRYTRAVISEPETQITRCSTFVFGTIFRFSILSFTCHYSNCIDMILKISTVSIPCSSGISVLHLANASIQLRQLQFSFRSKSRCPTCLMPNKVWFIIIPRFHAW